jgi:hypothetical protein
MQQLSAKRGGKICIQTGQNTFINTTFSSRENHIRRAENVRTFSTPQPNEVNYIKENPQGKEFCSVLNYEKFSNILSGRLCYKYERPELYSDPKFTDFIY